MTTNLVEAAIAQRPFHQLTFMSDHQFKLFLSNRGYHLDSAKIESLIDHGAIERLNTGVGDFHAFQIWPVSQIWNLSETRFTSGFGRNRPDPEFVKNWVEAKLAANDIAFTVYQENGIAEEFNQRILPFLLWLESYYLPMIKNRLVNTNVTEWQQWSRSFSLENLLDEHSISIDRLKEWRTELLLEAHINDPCPDMYFILRSMRSDRRERFKGRLRLAYDLYEVAEMTRLFLEQVSAIPQKKEWDPMGDPETPWVANFYGSQPEFGNPTFLRNLIRRHGLDPAFRVVWLVEGDTEQGFIERYAERIGATLHHFVSIRNFGGDGNFIRRNQGIDADLAAARIEQCFVTLTFDESNGARRRLEGLTETELLTFPSVLSDPDFELEHFRIEQLVDVAMRWASELSKPVRVCRECVICEIASLISSSGSAGGFKTAFNKVMRLNREEYRLSKNVEWGIRLADHVIEPRLPETEGGEFSMRDLSRIEKQLFFVIKNGQPYIDYALSVENLDPERLEI